MNLSLIPLTFLNQIGLEGEALSLHSLSGSPSVEWVEGAFVSQKQPLTWYKVLCNLVFNLLGKCIAFLFYYSLLYSCIVSLAQGDWSINISLMCFLSNFVHLQTTFNAPAGNEPLALDLNSMSKGQVWINGESIGRHMPGYKATGGCGACNYAGWFNEKKCLSNCGEASQRWYVIFFPLSFILSSFWLSELKTKNCNTRYHVPRSWLYPTGNLLVVFEEWGGDPHGISLVKREIGSVCADIFEWQPQLVNWQLQASGKVNKPLRPKAHLRCAPGQKISSIKFASFGTPEGSCGSFREGSCHAHHSYDAFEKVLFFSFVFSKTRPKGRICVFSKLVHNWALLFVQYCIGQESCSVTVAPELFGGDPCPSVMKKLSVEAICSWWFFFFLLWFATHFLIIQAKIIHNPLFPALLGMKL